MFLADFLCAKIENYKIEVKYEREKKNKFNNISNNDNCDNYTYIK